MPNSLSGKTVLVSGIAGFLGSHVARSLLKAGARVIGLVRPSSDFRRIAGIRHQIELRHQPAPADLVLHLAAAGVQPGVADLDLIENIALTQQLLASADPATRFLHAGSCFEYPAGLLIPESTGLAPRSLYGVTKAASTLLVNTYAARLHVSTLRLFTIYGPSEAPHRLIPSAIHAARRNQSLPLTDGVQLRDFVYVEDAAAAFLAAAAAVIPSGETINIASGHSTAVRTVVEAIYRHAAATAMPGFGALPQRTFEYTQLTGHPAKAAQLLAWRATTPLEAGIANTIASLVPETTQA